MPDAVIDDPGDAIVRPIAVATCDLDTAMLSGRAPASPPFAFGHECVADVVEVGADVRGFSAGDRVVVPFQLSCGTCASCVRGNTGSCRSVPSGSAYGLGSLGATTPACRRGRTHPPGTGHGRAGRVG